MSGPAERLRVAADEIERRAAKAGGPDWSTWLGFARRAQHIPPEAAPWITTMGPHIAAAPLAAWLRDGERAIDHGVPEENFRRALAFADQILGEATR
jgi:hypothetical protein